MNSLAEKSLFFKNAFANGPNTRHSVPSFLTSTYPLLFLQEAQGGKIHPGRKTIAEILKNNGYTTAAIHSNPYISAFYGYNRGFDFFNDFLLGQVEDDIKRNVFSKTVKEIVKGVKAVVMKKLPHENGETINEEAVRWLETLEKEPFFLWVHYMDVHMPYVPPNEQLKELGLKRYGHARKIWLGQKIDDVKMREKIKDSEIEDYINLYDACIRYTDEQIKKLISVIEKKYQDTLFVISADHGEEFREHGDLSHLEKLYDELLHVPLVFYGRNVKHQMVEKPVSLISLSPTILDFIGVNNKNWFQGKNVFEANPFIIAETWKKKRITAYRDEEWKFILSGDKRELYHVKDDPLEKRNLYLDKNYRERSLRYAKLIVAHINKNETEQRYRQTCIHKQKIKRAVGRMKI